jgi:hypothetical protein
MKEAKGFGQARWLTGTHRKDGRAFQGTKIQHGEGFGWSLQSPSASLD